MADRETSRNVLRRIEDLANANAKDYNLIHLMPRGASEYLDKNLRGDIRFARRKGNFLPIIEAQNKAELIDDSLANKSLLVVDQALPGFSIENAMVSIGPGLELAKIFDFDPVSGAITTVDPLVAPHSAGAGIALYGVPIEIIGNWDENDTVVQIRSSYPVVSGDQIAMATAPALINSTVSTLISGVTFLGTALDGRTNYQLTLDKGISRAVINEENIFLRCQPGYESQTISLAIGRPSRLNGPFVVDAISGSFFEDTEIDEYLNLQLFGSTGNPLPGYEDPVSVGKNFAVTHVSINNESMLFWDVIYGEVQFRGNKFVAITDANGRFVLSTELVPEFPPGVSWNIPVQTNGAATLRFKFEPNGYQTYYLVENILARISTGIASTHQPGTRIEIVVRSQQPGVEVEFGNWAIASGIASLRYQITSTAVGNNVWESSSLIIKPYFFTLDDISARFDFSSYNRGVVHF